jgi:hypothetical protein
MKGASGEREWASRPALALGPDRLKPVPAALSLSWALTKCHIYHKVSENILYRIKQWILSLS